MESREDILKLFKHIHDNIEQQLNATLKTKGLTMSQGHILRILRHQENYMASFKDIEKALGVAQSTTAGLVSRLEKKEFIETFTDPNDKRVKIVKLTPTGIEAMDNFKVGIEVFESKLFSNLTDIELTLLAELLKKVNSTFK